MNLLLTDELLDRMVRAVEAVKNRLKRAAAALEAGGVPSAVVGGHAVAVWVESMGEGGVRNTPDVDILIRRADFPAARAAFVAAGFVYAPGQPHETFLDGPTARPRDAVHLLFAGERVRPTDVTSAPDVADSTVAPNGQRVIALLPLVSMKLTAYRLKDKVHLRDMIDVGLIDATWPAKFPPPLGERLQAVLDDPDG